MIREDDVLDRLLAYAGPAGPTTAYGPEADHVYETYGPVDAPLVVVVHGGFWRTTIDRAHARPQARALAEAGWRVVLAEYRRVPGDPGASIADLRALRRHLGGEGVWVGHSAGGTLTLLMSLFDGVRSVALAPVADLEAARRDGLGGGAVDRWLGATDAAATDPARLVVPASEATQLVTLLHGSEDATVPPSQSAGYPARSVILDGAHHYDLVDPASAHWSAVLAEISG